MLIACLPANLYRFGYDNLVIYSLRCPLFPESREIVGSVHTGMNPWNNRKSHGNRGQDPGEQPVLFPLRPVAHEWKSAPRVRP
jgi:hypothetical protein